MWRLPVRTELELQKFCILITIIINVSSGGGVSAEGKRTHELNISAISVQSSP